jgi:hypothetical protein
MITVPTGELVGLLSDATPFADAEKNATTHACVLVEWDGEMLHTQATDRIYWGHASWHPNDDPDTEVAEEQLLAQWGGADNPWRCVIELADARDVVKNFKLGAKEWGVVLNLDLLDDRLRISRARDDAHSALRQDLLCRPWPVNGELFPDVDVWLAGRGKYGRATDAVSFSARRLAAFAKVRQRGPITFGFWGPAGATDIAIGERFVGAIRPTPSSDSKPAASPAAVPVVGEDVLV